MFRSVNKYSRSHEKIRFKGKSVKDERMVHTYLKDEVIEFYNI
jgi:hypothetical protein